MPLALPLQMFPSRSSNTAVIASVGRPPFSAKSSEAVRVEPQQSA